MAPKAAAVRPVIFFRAAVGLAFGDALTAQPENVGQQKEEQQKSVFFRDSIKPDRGRIKGPKRRGYQSYFCAEQFGGQQVNENCS